MEGRGQGEAINFPPPPVPRRRTMSKTRPENPTDDPAPAVNGNSLPATIHVSSVGVEGSMTTTTTTTSARSARPTSFKSKLTKAVYVCIGMMAILSSVGIILDYYDIWDPCSVKIPYQTHCTVDTFLGGLLQRTEFTQESLCLLPGVFHSTQNSGWNVDCNQATNAADELPIQQPLQQCCAE